MPVPRATLRLQFHRDFGFDDALAQIDYFAALGISHVYASPVLAARPGSTHGYDVVDPARVNPELGGEEGLRRLVHALHDRKMGLIVDIVPNHMALSERNPWWRDVLLWGQHSAYAGWFDIDWQCGDPALYGKVLLPVLGRPYGEVLQAGELRLETDAARLCVACPGNRLPLAPEDYAVVLEAAASPRLAAAVAAFRRLLDAAVQEERRSLAAQAWRALTAVMDEPAARADIVTALKKFSPDEPGGARALHELLERQHYRLCDWRNAGDEINWRRFFEIGDLIGMRVERDDVFEAMHGLLFRLAEEGLIDGVRLDHIDGLAEPAAYVRRLRQRLASLRPEKSVYIVAEKILAAGESLPADWGLDGTTGYDFMDQAAAVLHDGTGAPALDALWDACRAESSDFRQLVCGVRRRLLERNFAAEFNTLVLTLHALARSCVSTRDMSLMSIRRCLRELLVHFSVYRTYGTQAGCDSHDAAVIRAAAAQARTQLGAADHAGLAALSAFLIEPQAPDGADPAGRRAALRWRALTRFQQLTPPLTAKSVEDTAFYRYGRLLSRNEVGAEPSSLALSPDAFHQSAAQRGRDFPHAMLATATHDHKRGEDARMRLAVLSEIPACWRALVQRWRTINQSVRGEAGIDAADELMLYQTLVGVWPFDGGDADADVAGLAGRVSAWQCKALREAKRRSDWNAPDLDYEERCDSFLKGILRAGTGNAFLPDLRRFVNDIAAAGALNSLSQTMLRLTVPGVPDLYQGCELWDFSLVDPDNRRAVDYRLRTQMMQQSQTGPLTLADWRSGVCKQQLIRMLLHFRMGRAGLFSNGDYLPLIAEGALSEHLICFARRSGNLMVLVLCSRHAARLIGTEGTTPLIPPARWGDTAVRLPPDCTHHQWQSILTGMRGAVHAGVVMVREVLTAFPVDLLVFSNGD